MRPERRGRDELRRVEYPRPELRDVPEFRLDGGNWFFGR